jgi:hypothetical protein
LIGSCVVSVSLVRRRARAGLGPTRSLRRDKLILRRAVLTRPARRRDEQNIRVLARTIQFSKNRLFSPDPVPFVVVRRTFQDYGKASYLSSPLLTSARLLAFRGRVKGGGAGRRTKKLLPQRDQGAIVRCDLSGRRLGFVRPSTPTSGARSRPRDYTTRRTACQPEAIGDPVASIDRTAHPQAATGQRRAR